MKYEEFRDSFHKALGAARHMSRTKRRWLLVAADKAMVQQVGVLPCQLPDSDTS